MKLLNIGCGSTFHPEWTNVDIESSSPEVKTYDIRKGLPYADASFDACYSSHVLEHLTHQEANRLLAESRRVLKPQGIVRIVVPDLEAIARHYLQTLEEVEAGKPDVEPNYDWIMLELFDQTVRSCSGGEMGRYLTNPDIKNKEFVRSRIGAEAEKFWQAEKTLAKPQSLIEKVRSKKLSKVTKKIQNAIAKNLVIWMAGHQAGTAFEEGIFRNSGEIHRWMYDRFSLRRILEKAGFVEVRLCEATESRIPDFNGYNLDVEAGKIRKPDSIFMEGIKP